MNITMLPIPIKAKDDKCPLQRLRVFAVISSFSVQPDLALLGPRFCFDHKVVRLVKVWVLLGSDVTLTFSRCIILLFTFFFFFVALQNHIMVRKIHKLEYNDSKIKVFFIDRQQQLVPHLIPLEVMIVKHLVFNTVLVILPHTQSSSSDSLVKVPSMKLVTEKNY